MAIPLKTIEKALDKVNESKAEALTEFEKLLGKGSSKDATDLQDLLKRKPGPKPKPEPKKEPRIINGVNVNADTDYTGSAKQVLKFSDAMEAVRAVLESSLPGRPDGVKNIPVTDPKFFGQVLTGLIESVGGPSESRQLREIYELMEKRVLTQKNRKKIFEKRGQTRRWP